MSYSSDIVIQTISFRPDDLIEVVYSEQRDLSDHVSIARMMLFDRALVNTEVEELLDTAREIVDLVLVRMKEIPKQTLGG